jgi:hypothetical protein
MYFMAIGRGRVSIEHGGWNCNCCESTIMQNLRGSCTLSWIKHENIITRLCQQPNNINCAKLFSYHIIYNLKYIAVCRVCTIKSYIVGYIWFVYFLLCFLMFFSRQLEIMEKTQSWKGHHFVVEVPTPNVYQISICGLLALFQNSELSIFFGMFVGLLSLTNCDFFSLGCSFSYFFIPFLPLICCPSQIHSQISQIHHSSQLHVAFPL